MRADSTAIGAPLVGLLALGLACSAPAKTDTATPKDGPTAAGPGTDPCAAYIERVAAGVRCQAVDHTHCQCELVAAAAPPTTTTDPPADTTASANTTSPTTTPTEPPPTPAGPVANLEFARGPANTIVQCMSGPCPTRSADFITTVYPPISIPAGGATVQLEFRALHYKPYVGTYNLVPGRNFIQFSLEREFGAPVSATFQFQGAPAGTTVECVSGPCPDKKAYPFDKFPEIPLSDDGVTLLLRFNAPGYRTATTSFQVRRGPNTVPVLMEKAPLGK